MEFTLNTIHFSRDIGEEKEGQEQCKDSDYFWSKNQEPRKIQKVIHEDFNITKSKSDFRMICTKSNKIWKSQEDIQILENSFKIDPTWSRETVKSLKTRLPLLSVKQIHKWGYDRKLLIKRMTVRDKANQSSKNYR